MSNFSRMLTQVVIGVIDLEKKRVHMDAMEALTTIEVDFANLRDKYERMLMPMRKFGCSKRNNFFFSTKTDLDPLFFYCVLKNVRGKDARA